MASLQKNPIYGKLRGRKSPTDYKFRGRNLLMACLERNPINGMFKAES